MSFHALESQKFRCMRHPSSWTLASDSHSNCHSTLALQNFVAVTKKSWSFRFLCGRSFFHASLFLSLSKRHDMKMKFRSNAPLISATFLLVLAKMKSHRDLQLSPAVHRPAIAVQSVGRSSALKFKVKSYVTSMGNFSSYSERESARWSWTVSFYYNFATVKTCSRLISLFLR